MEIVLVTGKVNSGKTTLLEKLVEQESLQGNSPTGIIARGVFKEGEKTGFNVVDLSTGKSRPLAKAEDDSAYGFSVGRFIFSNDSFDFAKKGLLNFKPNGVAFLDEVGPLELNDKGYAECLIKLLESDLNRLYIAVRDECLAKVRQKFLSSRQTKIIETNNADDGILIKSASEKNFLIYGNDGKEVF